VAREERRAPALWEKRWRRPGIESDGAGSGGAARL